MQRRRRACVARTDDEDFARLFVGYIGNLGSGSEPCGSIEHEIGGRNTELFNAASGGKHAVAFRNDEFFGRGGCGFVGIFAAVVRGQLRHDVIGARLVRFACRRRRAFRIARSAASQSAQRGDSHCSGGRSFEEVATTQACGGHSLPFLVDGPAMACSRRMKEGGASCSAPGRAAFFRSPVVRTGENVRPKAAIRSR